MSKVCAPRRGCRPSRASCQMSVMPCSGGRPWARLDGASTRWTQAVDGVYDAGIFGVLATPDTTYPQRSPRLWKDVASACAPAAGPALFLFVRRLEAAQRLGRGLYERCFSARKRRGRWPVTPVHSCSFSVAWVPLVHRELHRRRRSRSPQITDKIGNREIDLMPNGADYRDRAVRNGTRQLLIIECPQVLERAATTRHDQHIGGDAGTSR